MTATAQEGVAHSPGFIGRAGGVRAGIIALAACWLLAASADGESARTARRVSTEKSASGCAVPRRSSSALRASRRTPTPNAAPRSWSCSRASGVLGASDAPVNKRAPANVVCRLPGSLPRRILIGAHFDKLGLGRGIVDNWAGAAMLANLVEALLPVEQRHELLFVRILRRRKASSALAPTCARCSRPIAKRSPR